MKNIFLAAAVMSVAACSGQKKNVSADSLFSKPIARHDSSGLSSEPGSYEKIVTAAAKTMKGMFLVHKVEEKYYLEIPDSLLGRDILIVNRISKAATAGDPGTAGYAGDQIADRIVRFEKGPENRLFLKNISYSFISNDTVPDGMYHSVLNSNLQPIIASFPIKALGREKMSSIVDFTDLIKGDNTIFWLSGSSKKMWAVGAFQADKSYINHCWVFNENLEINAIKTYSLAADQGMSLTWELNSSMVLLPKIPMTPRYSDDRVGYFSQEFIDFDTDPQRVKRSSYITRWRLEPKYEDREKYFRGELVEPQKQIIYYIDPTTPKKWIPYLIQGVNDWQAAFEKAGFRNAIIGKVAPADDSTWSLSDARHSALVYKPSPIANAQGPHIHDPRSGEILEAHINWYHNVMTILHDWYMIQAGAVDARARKMEFDDELMGELIRFVSSHEIGHTLGLLHNFGSSSTVPVDSLRIKKWVELYGHTPSIMDYARFNYVAQPGDNIGYKGIYPRIGDYDKWAIQWGYRLFPDIKNAKNEDELLNKWILDSLNSNHRLWYSAQNLYSNLDPRNQSEDLGDDAMKAGDYGIENLKRITELLPAWTRSPNKSYDDLERMYKEVVGQFGRYAGHVAGNVGGYYLTARNMEEKGELYEPVPSSIQRQAVQWLNKQVFKTPSWLYMPSYISKIQAPFTTEGAAEKVVFLTLSNLLNERRLVVLLNTSKNLGGSKNYSASAFLEDLSKGLWQELVTHKTVDVYRRQLQNNYIGILSGIINQPTGSDTRELRPGTGIYRYPFSELVTVVRTHLKLLKAAVVKGIPAARDSQTRIHLETMLEKINIALKPKTGLVP